MNTESLKKEIFLIDNEDRFEEIALEIFHHQSVHNPVLHHYLSLTGRDFKPQRISDLTFLPIEFFKEHKVITGDVKEKMVFTSSGTTNEVKRSMHHVADPDLYRYSFLKTFEHFLGPVSDMHVLSILPNYEENPQSSLLYMVDHLIERSLTTAKRAYQADSILIRDLEALKGSGKKIVLFGVSFALLHLAEQFEANLGHVTLIETGGMKGRRRELTRQALHQALNEKLRPAGIVSEYGMTELLSQAYAMENGMFSCPPWMKVRLRDLHDPFMASTKKSGAIDIIDLANLESCAFIASSDLGRMHENGKFEVLGRMDYSDIRGCNLLFEG